LIQIKRGREFQKCERYLARENFSFFLDCLPSDLLEHRGIDIRFASNMGQREKQGISLITVRLV